MNTILAAPDLLKIEKISFRSDEVRLVVKTWLMNCWRDSVSRSAADLARVWRSE
jgi:hypothetical protein